MVCSFGSGNRLKPCIASLSCSATESEAFSTRLTPLRLKTIINCFLCGSCPLRLRILFLSTKKNTLNKSSLCSFGSGNRLKPCTASLSCSATESEAFSTRLTPLRLKTIINCFLYGSCPLRLRILFLSTKKEHPEQKFIVFFWQRK